MFSSNDPILLKDIITKKLEKNDPDDQILCKGNVFWCQAENKANAKIPLLIVFSFGQREKNQEENKPAVKEQQCVINKISLILSASFLITVLTTDFSWVDFVIHSLF